MRFDTLNELIPHATGKKLHVLTMSPYNAITLATPGRHQGDTPTPGADFVVMVSDTETGWINHQFTHDDLFLDIETKAASAPGLASWLMNSYAKVIFGDEATDAFWTSRGELPGIHPQTFLYAVQCLGVAEHRRYAKFETKGGGRFLPARFASGIVEGRWTAADCKAVQRRGRPGVEWLEAQYGKPTPLKELAA